MADWISSRPFCFPFSKRSPSLHEFHANSLSALIGKHANLLMTSSGKVDIRRIRFPTTRTAWPWAILADLGISSIFSQLRYPSFSPLDLLPSRLLPSPSLPPKPPSRSTERFPSRAPRSSIRTSSLSLSQGQVSIGATTAGRARRPKTPTRFATCSRIGTPRSPGRGRRPYPTKCRIAARAYQTAFINTTTSRSWSSPGTGTVPVAALEGTERSVALAKARYRLKCRESSRCSARLRPP